MSHHGAKPGQGWKRKLEAAREALDTERALTRTLRSYVEKRDASIRLYEDANAVLKQLGAEVAAELAELRAHPVVKTSSPERERLPDTRRSETWTLRIGPLDSGTACTVHIGFYPTGNVGEVFLRFSKSERGTHGASMADLAVTMLSIALQYGAPLEELVAKMIGAADESGGITRVCTVDGSWSSDPDVPQCRSLRDYIGKKLRARFCRPEGVVSDAA